MKYADGLWLNKPGYGVNYATQMYEVTADETSINVLATNQWIGNRGMTLGGPVLEITFTSTLENTIKVSIDHYKGRVHKSPDFQLNEDKSFRPVIKETDGAYELISGNTKVVVAKGGAWDIKYYYNDKLLTKEGWRTTSYITEDQWKTNERMANDEMKPFFSHDETADGAVMREMLNLSVGECHLRLRREVHPLRQERPDASRYGTTTAAPAPSRRLQVHPLLRLQPEGTACSSTTPRRWTFEVATETVSKVAFVGSGRAGCSISSSAARSIDRRHLDLHVTLTGKPALHSGLLLRPVADHLLHHQLRRGYSLLLRRRHGGARASRSQVFHFDCFWMKEFNWCDFTWDKRMFPDPKGYAGQTEGSAGLQICVWINSYIAPALLACSTRAWKGGYFLKTKDGSVWQGDMWQPGMAIVDFTNPAACEWYKGKLRALCEMGVNAFKTDFGERIPTKDVVYYDGSDPYKMHNYYTLPLQQRVYSRCSRNSTARTRPACSHVPRPLAVSSSRYTGAATASPTTNPCAETLRGGLSLCMSGFGYFSHDISGFEAQRSSPTCTSAGVPSV